MHTNFKLFLSRFQPYSKTILTRTENSIALILKFKISVINRLLPKCLKILSFAVVLPASPVCEQKCMNSASKLKKIAVPIASCSSSRNQSVPQKQAAAKLFSLSALGLFV
jgi:hypothetical protein